MRRHDLAILSAVALSATSLVVQAETYLSPEQAMKIIYANMAMQKRSVELTPAQIETIQTASKEKVSSNRLNLFCSSNKDVLFIEDVFGKHEFITVAVGIDSTGTVRGVEILSYRESYGDQITNEKWRHQFIGKTSASTLKLNKDIKNISGATISSSHVTSAVRRLLSTYDIIKTQL